MKKTPQKHVRNSRKHVNRGRFKVRIKPFKPHKLRITRPKKLIQFV